MAKALAKGSRITGAQRTTLASQYARRYAAGESIRKIAEDAGRSFGFVHGVLKEAGVELRGRGGATRGAKKAASSSQQGRAPRLRPRRPRRRQLRRSLPRRQLRLQPRRRPPRRHRPRSPPPRPPRLPRRLQPRRPQPRRRRRRRPPPRRQRQGSCEEDNGEESPCQEGRRQEALIANHHQGPEAVASGPLRCCRSRARNSLGPPSVPSPGGKPCR